jgi:aconitate decarboxylase
MSKVDGLGVMLDHVLCTPGARVPERARAATRKFVLDSLGVGVNGSSGPHVDALLEMYRAQDGVGVAGVLGTNVRLAPAAAAFMNAYQIHNSEYDCVHELAVVHPMAVMLGAITATVWQLHAAGTEVSGEELEVAITLAIDVAAGLGIASAAPLSFFRPGTAGAFAATMAVARLRGFSIERARNAVGILLGQLSGTMQAHIEGSAVLAMQVGFNARNALVSCDMAAAGIVGPQDSLQGPFGFFALFEGAYDLEPVLNSLGHDWRIEEVAHKPFPSGRATHGIVDACLSMRREFGFNASAVASVSAFVPPLTQRLVGRPVRADMNVNYARLCAPYVTAVALLGGDVQPEDFSATALVNAATLELAARVDVVIDGNTDPNALTPIRVVVNLRDGSRHELTLSAIYGNPASPMLRAAYIEKLRKNLRRARDPIVDVDNCADTVIAVVETLSKVRSAAKLLQLLQAEPS